MKLINNSSDFFLIDKSLIKIDAIQLLEITHDTKNLGGKEHLYISTGLVSFKIYGKKKIREFLQNCFGKGTINEILLGK